MHLLDAVCDQRPKDDRATAGVLGCQLLDKLDTNGALVPRLCRSDGNRVAEVQIAAGNVVEQIVGCCDSKPFQCGGTLPADTIEVGNGLKQVVHNSVLLSVESIGLLYHSDGEKANTGSNEMDFLRCDKIRLTCFRLRAIIKAMRCRNFLRNIEV